MASPIPSPPPPKRTSLLWLAFAVLAWGLLLYQVFVRLPQQTDILRELNVPLPPFSQWMLHNASWAVPVLGLVSTLLAGLIRDRPRRWFVLGLVPIFCLLLFLGIQYLALLQHMAGDHPRGL